MDGARVLYLHGRGDNPSDPPGDLVSEVVGDYLEVPALDEGWLRRPFPRQISDVSEWLASSSAAIGHSYGGWLLLCANYVRMLQGKAPVPLVLLASVVGSGGAGQMGYVVPWSRPVGVALGLDGRPDPRMTRAPIVFVHARDDDQCPPTSVVALANLYDVVWVSGGHRLDDPEARVVVRRTLAQRLLGVDTDRLDGPGQDGHPRHRGIRRAAEPSWPLTFDEAVQAVAERLHPRTLQWIRAAPEAAMSSWVLHFTVGLDIRNRFGLWRGNHALLLDCVGREGEGSTDEVLGAQAAVSGVALDPDRASRAILRGVWRKVRNESPLDRGRPVDSEGEPG